MRLLSFTVERFRSITTARKIRTDELTILIGPNNEGKSNILRALVTAMFVLTRGHRVAVSRGVSPRLLYDREFYNWERDFPLHMQSKSPNGKSEVILEFGLTDEELELFRIEIGSTLNGTLPLRIEIGRREAKVTVAKQGRGAKTLGAKSGPISHFIAERLDFEHIPAVRTASSAKRVVDHLVQRELASLENNEEYRNAIDEIARLQQPVLDKLSESIKKTLVGFLPDVHDVRIEMSQRRRYHAFSRECEIVVDDGAATLLEYKGDGVQSLAALGIMRHASERSESLRNLVVAIEEPESHLHPNAIHELKDVLLHLAQHHQVVLTTHCPLFVNRAALRSNIVVSGNRARPAKSIVELREILGVRASDNLRHAELILLVEGEDDATALKALLRHFSKKLCSAIDSGGIGIDWLSGGTNLAYKASLVRDALCLVHCFLDNDRCGRDAFEKARKLGILTDRDVNYATCTGKSDSEIEDIYDVSLYEPMLKNNYRLSLSCSAFRSNKKWSDRMKATFGKHGKVWNDRIACTVKRQISELVAESPERAIEPRQKDAFNALVSALEERLQELSEKRV